jgi:hypothetical protein
VIYVEVKCSHFSRHDYHERKILSFFLDMIAKNEIKDNNCDVNVLWKENIASLWVLKHDLVSIIAGDSDFT